LPALLDSIDIHRQKFAMSFQQYNDFAQQQQGGSASPTGGNAPAGQVVPQPGQPSASPAPYNNGAAPPSGNGASTDGSKTTLWYVFHSNATKNSHLIVK
jgi:hypothetical protein